MPVVEEATPAGDELRGLLRSTIAEIADQGEAVIIAHAASFALSAKPEVLRVFLTASPQKRAARTAEARGCDAKEAEKLFSRGDGNRADYLKRFYKVSSEGPTDYDVAVNTDRVTPDQAADLIAQAARAA
jgi:cytidylate kinase